MAWTKEQQRIIEDRDSSILVSASAGSGKTAVLVERICSKIMDREHPKDIDSFLVVTFTKAAAAQMREKIASKIEKELEKEPDNAHLNRQLILVNRADISTIDSFCLKIIKEYFSVLDMDSTYGIGDSGMMELIKNDVLDALFEKKYEQREEKFLMLADIFCSEGNDDLLKKEILKIYQVSESHSLPDEWFVRAKQALEIESGEELRELPWIRELIRLVHNQVKDALKLVKRAKEVCMSEGGPDKNLPVICSDEETLSDLLHADTYEALFRKMSDLAWGRLKPCRGDAYDEALSEELKQIRGNYKEMIKEVSIFSADENELLAEMENLKFFLVPLLDLTIEFSALFSEEKKKRKLMDFADAEHMAYRLVCAGYDGEGRPVPTEIGREISERYEEIFIDEYQDSNFLQEDILCSVSGMSQNKYHMFMVGDVKQSIYRFRMARPDLFLEKYNRFCGDGKKADEIKIELRHNFRSRAVVLNAVNFFFQQLMGEDLGGISYGGDVALVAGKEFPDAYEDKDRIAESMEILIADSEDGESEDADAENVSKLELEALVIAKRIKEIVSEDGLLVFDETSGTYRPAVYGDIVILSRSIKGFGDILYNTLSEQGIPVYVESPQGYFDAVEIRLILSLLSVVDNARQDIPLAAVLLSAMGGLDENELALICDHGAKKEIRFSCLYEKCLCYREEKTDELSKKLGKFLDMLEDLKGKKTYLSISELIWSALEETGFYLFAAAMPMGERRTANIHMLLEKAVQFENGYYKGLFHFLRYVEKLRVNEMDFGEANISGEANTVRIMSMHKSKGLEYPIVFVSGLSKQFNQNDRKDNLIVHSDYYLAAMAVNRENRYKKKTLAREAFRILMKNESVAEELRILYVAMTRAKEKLILTGCEADLKKQDEKYSYLKEQEEILLPYSLRRNASGFMQWIYACMARYEKLGKTCGAVIERKVYSSSKLAKMLGEKVVLKNLSIDRIMDEAASDASDELYERYRQSFDYQYPYEPYTKIKSKMSISEIKRMKAFDGETYESGTEETNPILREGCLETEKTPEEDRLSGAEEKKDRLSGAERGTLVHKFMELISFGALKALPYERKEYQNYVRTFKEKLLSDQIFDEREAQAINLHQITAMLMSDLGQRMIAADAEKKLYREQQFSIGIPAERIYPELGDKKPDESGGDIVIVQGIIDAFFYENGEIVLMDYKTDRAKRDVLIGHYRAQLDYYAETLERLTGCRVKEKLIYSFYLEEEIGIDFEEHSC